MNIPEILASLSIALITLIGTNVWSDIRLKKQIAHSEHTLKLQNIESRRQLHEMRRTEEDRWRRRYILESGSDFYACFKRVVELNKVKLRARGKLVDEYAKQYTDAVAEMGLASEKYGFIATIDGQETSLEMRRTLNKFVAETSRFTNKPTQSNYDTHIQPLQKELENQMNQFALMIRRDGGVELEE